LPGQSGRNVGWIAVVLAVAVLVRLLYFLEIRQTPFFLAPVIDAAFYNDLGRTLAAGEGTGRAPFMMPPLYPLVLSLLYRLGGVSLPSAHALQFVFGVLSTLMTFAIARRVAGLAVAVLAALMVGTSRALLFVEGDLLATPLAVLLDLVFLFWMLRFRDSASWRDLVPAGIFLGLAALTRPPVLVVLPVFVGWLLWRRRRPAAAVVLVVLALLPIVPVTLHNLRANGELVLISANGGINFWIGNNRDMRQTVAMRPGPEWRRMNDLPLRQAGKVTPVERDRWFWREAMAEIRRDLPAAMQRSFEKTLLLIHDHEIMRDFDFYYFRDHFSRVLRMPSASFAFLLAFALVGAFLARPRRPSMTVLWMFAIPYALSIVAFFVTARYRAPLLPVLAIAAAVGLVWLWQQLQQRRLRAVVSAVLLVAIATVVSCVDWYGVDTVDVAESKYRIAKAQENAGDLALALQGYEEVLQLAPAHALAAARAAGCEQQLGRVQEAVVRYETILEQHPEYVEVMINLANMAWRYQDAPMARDYFELAIATDPWYAQAHGYYAMFAAGQGNPQQAIALYDKALELDPTWEQLRFEKARAFLAMRDASGALRTLRELPAAIFENSSQAYELEGDALALAGRNQQAEASWRRAVQIDPNNRSAYQKLHSAGR